MSTGRATRRSTRPRTARRAAARAARKGADRAERRGRQVPPTVDGFSAALADRGYDGVAEALISRHNQRMQRLHEAAEVLQQCAFPALSGYLPMQLVAQELGAHPGRWPSHSGGTWPDHLAWGLDSVAAAVRLMLAIQPVGAAVLSRTQLERWSSNLRFNSALAQIQGEDTAAWLTRLWTSPGVSLIPRSSSVGALFADLSEVLHGRGPLMPLVWLDVADVTALPTGDQLRLMDTLTDAQLVSLTQLRNCLATAAEEKDWPVLAETAAAIRLIEPAHSWTPDVAATVVPLIPSHFAGLEGQLGALATGHAKSMHALRHGQDPEYPSETWPLFAFGQQRFRALITARRAFEHERELLGERFGEHGIEELGTEAVLSGEMAAMLAVWLRERNTAPLAADAFAVCASALRSAHWLWLEDDDRAMGCLRCVIEQLARARTWRVKPERATRIEATQNATPRDWIEGSGWRRLGLMNRALGEFAHGSTSADWSLARDALVALQSDPQDELARFTGRSHALSALIFMVSVECSAWVDQFSTELGEAYRKVIRINDDQANRAIEALMNRAWNARATPLRRERTTSPHDDRGAAPGGSGDAS
ncbi:protein of unknown function [Modestobacter italicus]|uniref:Uncharacterized protein n=1 Tax=Modestobacter italicus (strain DSM 44449 / CECT 9708 / BC 501) TaxID=2732864 RepID=I4F0G3_MODI5|nr:protein of unknown function [Modestobacter marinus]